MERRKKAITGRGHGVPRFDGVVRQVLVVVVVVVAVVTCSWMVMIDLVGIWMMERRFTSHGGSYTPWHNMAI